MTAWCVARGGQLLPHLTCRTREGAERLAGLIPGGMAVRVRIEVDPEG